MTPVFIGIAGASASGKSLLAETIHQELCEEIGSDKIAIIKEDAYYKDQSHMSFEDREKTNYDHPAAFDRDLLINHLDELRNGKSVEIPSYDYAQHNRSKETVNQPTLPVIILEGILLLNDQRVRHRLDTSIFVDTPLDICFIRRLKRDTALRGRTMKSVIQQYTTTVRPMYWQFIEPSKQHADIIVPRGGKNREAIEMLKARIRQTLSA